MTLNVAVATWRYIACVADRRITGLGPGNPILSERSNKLTQFDLENGCRGFITYNGIGWDGDNRSPSQWLADLQLRRGMSLTDLVQLIKEDAEPRIRRVAPLFSDNPRHSFVIAAFAGAKPVICLLSNYEHLNERKNDEQAAGELRVEWCAASDARGNGYAVFVAGALLPQTRRRIERDLVSAVRRGAPVQSVIKRITRAVRTTAFASHRVGSVGTSVHFGYLPQFGPASGGSDILGGATIHEGPNFISPSVKMTDLYLGGPTERQRRLARGEKVEGPPVLTEPLCRSCGAPVPEGYRRCGRCGAPIPQAERADP